jgi:hypothetical protein
MNKSKFWVVWQPEGGSPTFRHETEVSATREAERLAESDRGRAFYVLEAVSVSRKVSVVTTKLEEDQELPF